MGGIRLCRTSLTSFFFSNDKLLIPALTFHSNQALNFFFFFYVSPSSPCCDRHLNWLSCAPGSDTTACCLLFVDYYWFSLILHLKINSQSRRKIGAVYTYFNILLCNGEGHSFGSGCDGSSQLRGKLLTGERERPQIDSKLSSPITESGHKLERICFVSKTAMKHGCNFFFFYFFISWYPLLCEQPPFWDNCSPLHHYMTDRKDKCQITGKQRAYSVIYQRNVTCLTLFEFKMGV